MKFIEQAGDIRQLNLTEIAYAIKRRVYRFLLQMNKRVIMTGKVHVNGWPMIIVENNARIVIGNNVLLNSVNRHHHLNMHSPVKLVATRDSALITIGDNSKIHGSCIHAWEKVTIGKNCLIAANCQIFDCSTHDLSFDNVENRVNTNGKTKPVIIGNNVWICANTVILPGVTIGEGSVIAAGSVVTGNIPAFTLAGGNPAKIIRQYFKTSVKDNAASFEPQKMEGGIILAGSPD